MPDLFLPFVIFMIVGSIALIGYVFYDSSVQRNEIDQMSCNELWDKIKQNTDDHGTTGEYVLSKWIVKECWK